MAAVSVVNSMLFWSYISISQSVELYEWIWEQVCKCIVHFDWWCVLQLFTDFTTERCWFSVCETTNNNNKNTSCASDNEFNIFFGYIWTNVKKNYL